MSNTKKYPRVLLELDDVRLVQCGDTTPYVISEEKRKDAMGAEGWSSGPLLLKRGGEKGEDARITFLGRLVKELVRRADKGEEPWS